MDLNEFVDEKDGEKDDYTYVLHAVLVHIGDAQGGHYVVYINAGLTPDYAPGDPDDYRHSTWCKFNDELVSRAAFRDAVTANYGGGGGISPLGEPAPDWRTLPTANAYMLVYVKQASVGDVLEPVTAEDIPAHLKERFEKEKAMEEHQRLQKEEEARFVIFFVRFSFFDGG